MADHVFYEPKSRGNTRVLTIKGARLLPGRAPTNTKRIVIPVVMKLSNTKTTGQPEWIEVAHNFVAKNHDPIHSKVKFNGFDIDFATENQNLFNDGKVSAPRCQMRSFVITEQGGEEEPDIVMTFDIIAPFSTALWDYLGQVSNDEIWTKFSQGAAPPEEDDQEDLELDGDDETDENGDESDGDGEYEDEEDTEDDSEGEDDGTDADSEADE